MDQRDHPGTEKKGLSPDNENESRRSRPLMIRLWTRMARRNLEGAQRLFPPQRYRRLSPGNGRLVAILANCPNNG